MPTYEYACKGCGEHLEVVQSFKDDPLTVCPGCSGELRKVFSAAGIIFKGSGWHVKDYAPSRSSSTAASGEDAGSRSKDGADTGSSSSSDGGSTASKGPSSEGSSSSSSGSSSSPSTGSSSTAKASSSKAAAAKSA
jgi:putative FmdB family regulatory protein